MSPTYKYARESLGDEIFREEYNASYRMKKKLEWRKKKRKKKIKADSSFKKFISFRDRLCTTICWF
jgi:hypothetical protein